MHTSFKKFLFAISIFLLPVALQAALVFLPEIRLLEGQGIGYNRGYASLNSFMIPEELTGCVTPFIDLRAHHLYDNSYAINAGLGGRTTLDCWDGIFGLNVYYDWRQYCRSKYNQIGVGLELLSEVFSFRVNGYLPVGSVKTRRYKKISGSREESSVGSSHFSHSKSHKEISFVLEKSRFPLSTIDAEIEGLLCDSNDAQVFCALGTYYLHKKGHHKSAYGGSFKLRIEYSRLISMEVNVTTDRLFKTCVQGQIAFSIPLAIEGCNGYLLPYSREQRLLLERVQRREIIAIK